MSDGFKVVLLAVLWVGLAALVPAWYLHLRAFDSSLVWWLVVWIPYAALLLAAAVAVLPGDKK